ncbi:hypothetical protein D0817_13930 [Flavobacterium cupreum]|uniref:BZIP transcription factor n=1 Tax=Flavobacterium cupreum TaxID=2133766 RepID=A0A434A5V8_9FLAO|nr:hypothetical protein [Flavobacterium cupreum]RUT69717.1 hypothetical protein D0817_13930 [Flavobacterium cupreum]
MNKIFVLLGVLCFQYGFAQGIITSTDNSVNAVLSSSVGIPKTDSSTGTWTSTNAYWASPLIYRTRRFPDNGTGAFPFNEYGELMIQGTSHGSAFNKGITFLTWDGSATPAQFRMRIAPNGYIGIGTTTPLAKLEVSNGNVLIRNLANNDNESAVMIAQSINYSNRDTFGTSIRTITQSAGNNVYAMQLFTQESYLTGQTEKVRIQGNGNVGIGVANPLNKLDVNGTIHSKEVKVDMEGWSDFVFKKQYPLPTLEEVERHIEAKGHLENIPNEEEVLKDGINLGEMNAKLLQKIEEMTLYLINQNKQIIDLKSRLEKLEVGSK